MALAFRAHQQWHCDLAGSFCSWQLILMPGRNQSKPWTTRPFKWSNPQSCGTMRIDGESGVAKFEKSEFGTSLKLLHVLSQSHKAQANLSCCFMLYIRLPILVIVF